MFVGLLLASVAAVAFGSGTFVQHMSAADVETADQHGRTERGLLRLLARLVTQPTWLIGQAMAGGGTALQFTALAFAPVAVVEPLIAAGLPVALTLEAIRARSRPSFRLVGGLVLCVAGLVLFLLFSRAGEPTRRPGIGTGIGLLFLGMFLALVSRFVPIGRVGSVVAGTAAGATLGVAVVAVAIAVHRLQRYGVVGTITNWRPYIALAIGLLATAASQQAYARGELAWSLPALTVADPLVATVLSVLVLREHLASSGTPFWATGALLAVVGVAFTASGRYAAPPVQSAADRAPQAVAT